jgi:hypothetical protein
MEENVTTFTDDRLRSLLAFPADADMSAVQAAVRGLTAVNGHSVQALSAAVHSGAPAVTDAEEDAAFAAFSSRLLNIPTAVVNPQGYDAPNVVDAAEDAAFAVFSSRLGIPA